MDLFFRLLEEFPELRFLFERWENRQIAVGSPQSPGRAGAGRSAAARPRAARLGVSTCGPGCGQSGASCLIDSSGQSSTLERS